MKKLMTICAVVGLMFAIGSPMADASVTIDFEAYSDYQNLHGLNLGGVTLTNPSGNVEVYANNRLAAWYKSPVNSIASHTSGSASINPLVGVFDVPATYVSLWAGDAGGDNDQWRLDAYDAVAGGNLLGSVLSPIWNGNPYTQLSISASNIMRFEAYWLDPTGEPWGIAYDDLKFQPIPAPGAILLGSIGVGFVGWLRRRRTL